MREDLLRKLLCTALLCGVAACSSTGYHTAKAPQEPEEAIQLSMKDRSHIPSKVKIGTPYSINGLWYHPKHDPVYDQIGIASWYGPNFHGKRTANGEVFNQDAFTAAHPTLPLPSLAKVTNLENGKEIVLRINDRGPFAKNRIIDLSRASARSLGVIQNGTAKVRVQFLGKETAQMWAALDMDVPLLARRQVATSASPEAMHVASTSNKPKPLSPQFSRTAGKPTAPLMEAASIEEMEEEPANIEVAPLDAEDQQESTTFGAGQVHYVPAHQDIHQAMQSVGGGGDMVYIQAAAYSDRQNAEHAAYRVAQLGNTVLHPVEVNQQRFYRVRLGPLAMQENLEDWRLRLVDLGFKDAKIVQ